MPAGLLTGIGVVASYAKNQWGTSNGRKKASRSVIYVADREAFSSYVSLEGRYIPPAT